MTSLRVKRRQKSNALLDYVATGKIKDPEMLIHKTKEMIICANKNRYKGAINSYFMTTTLPKEMSRIAIGLYGVDSTNKLPWQFNKYIKNLKKTFSHSRDKKALINDALRLANRKSRGDVWGTALLMANKIKSLDHTNMQDRYLIISGDESLNGGHPFFDRIEVNYNYLVVISIGSECFLQKANNSNEIQIMVRADNNELKEIYPKDVHVSRTTINTTVLCGATQIRSLLKWDANIPRSIYGEVGQDGVLKFRLLKNTTIHGVVTSMSAKKENQR